MIDEFESAINPEMALSNASESEAYPGTADLPVNREKIFTTNFLLLWQGQLVSILGDVIYAIALGFWVLAVTGSTALMGTLMAVSTLPGVIISPFAGVIVDRVNRKKLLILMDIIRGAAVILLAASAFYGFIAVWMVFAVGIILGVCGAFYSPCVNSSIPDIVPKSKLMGANSMMGIIGAGSNIVGSPAGGLLLQALGASFLFLFNGVSFIISAAFNLFLKIPKADHKTEQHFLEDMKEGYGFVWRFRGLRYLLMIVAVMNFICFIAIVLFLPLFQRTLSLGAGRYGIAMACLTGGMLVAMIITSTAKIPNSSKLRLFMFAAVISCVSFSIIALVDIFPLMCAMAFIGGFCNAVINVFINSSIQLTVPQEMRGKVFSLVSMLSSSLSPFGMLLGGVLAEFIPIRTIIFTCFAITLLTFIPFGFMQSFKRFINFDPDTQKLEEIM